MATTIQTRRGTAAQAATANPVLAVGEAGRETDTGRLKFGDGTTAWKSLPYAPGTRFDQAEALAAKLDAKAGVCTLYVASDSTGVGTQRWARRVLLALAADNPDAQVRSIAWDDATQALLAPEVIQAGTNASSAGVKAADNFSRTGDLRGSTSSGPNAAVWGGDANAAGDWTLTSGTIVRSSDATSGKLLLDSGSAGDRSVAFASGTLSTVGQATASIFRVYTKYLDNSNLIYGYLNVSASGAATWGITRTIAGTSTAVSGAANPLTANTAGQAIAPTLTVSGLTVTFTLGNAGNSTVTMTLPQADADVLGAATIDGFSGGPAGSGLMTLGPFSTTVTSAAGPAQTITLYNGAVTGTTLDYQASRLAAQCPVTPDVVLINSCHNYGADTPATYLGKLDAFVALLGATWPPAGVVIMSQNPEKSPATGIAPHQLRLLAIRGWAAKRGVGYVPVLEAFRARADLGVNLVRSDGVHPTDNTDTADAASGTAASNGAQLWGRVVAGWLTAKRLATAPTS